MSAELKRKGGLNEPKLIHCGLKRLEAIESSDSHSDSGSLLQLPSIAQDASFLFWFGGLFLPHLSSILSIATSCSCSFLSFSAANLLQGGSPTAIKPAGASWRSASSSKYRQNIPYPKPQVIPRIPRHVKAGSTATNSQERHLPVDPSTVEKPFYGCSNQREWPDS
ncbi:unnamed protein product [Fusarium venenatum]|uniref:Uncharacterized protein n=1 Tax=Fusarium venenatum TaxID=56646 RepID=A0A2L2U1F1_9HYPO|nr:uncharacterized protein FVRRES_09127 [Fusarium venenatum]CEI69050.1 unnamed protein product [Fusarium venenatum]